MILYSILGVQRAKYLVLELLSGLLVPVALLLLGRVLWNATARRIEVQGG